MFILLYSEKNEPRSAAAVIGLRRSEAGAVLGGCGTRCVRQSSPSYLGRLASSRPDKGGGYHRDGKEARHSALRRGIQKNQHKIIKSTLVHPFTTTTLSYTEPRIKCGVTQCALGCGVAQRPYRMQRSSFPYRENTLTLKKIFQNIWFIL